jgi:lysophospholipase L1-like esterase
VNKFRSALTNLALFFSTSLILFFVLEAGARFQAKAYPFEPHEPPKPMPYLTEKDKNLRWRFSPKQDRNSLGLRNREVERKKEKQFRIFYLGDSLVFSGDTSSGKLYTQVIEEKLNQQEARAKDFEVVNAGVPGYTTYQELEFLKIYGLKMEPDLVVLGFALNDVYFKYLHKPSKTELLGNEPTIGLYRFNPYSFPGNLFSRSYLAHSLVYQLENLINSKIRGSYFPFEHRLDFYLAWKDYGWAKTRKLIGEMKSLLDELRIPLIVVVYPVSDQVDDKYLVKNREYVLLPQKKIKEIGAEYHIPTLDLTEIIYENGGEELFVDYLHLNHKGNEIVAETVSDYLEEHLKKAS